MIMTSADLFVYPVYPVQADRKSGARLALLLVHRLSEVMIFVSSSPRLSDVILNYKFYPIISFSEDVLYLVNNRFREVVEVETVPGNS